LCFLNGIFAHEILESGCLFEPGDGAAAHEAVEAVGGEDHEAEHDPECPKARASRSKDADKSEQAKEGSAKFQEAAEKSSACGGFHVGKEIIVIGACVPAGAGGAGRALGARRVVGTHALRAELGVEEVLLWSVVGA
jgi:hypothetical protein